MSQARSKSRVLVTGIGCVTNIGFDSDAVWDAMVAGNSGISIVTSG